MDQSAPSQRAVPARRGWASTLIGATVAGWIVLVSMGVHSMVSYDQTSGEEAAAPATWPVASTIERNEQGATVVMFAHPRCPCTRASMTELTAALAACPSARARILFYTPTKCGTEWMETDLWKRAKVIAAGLSIADPEGVEAQVFGARTSGHVVAYNASGRLIFQGGITGGRGQEGDNPSRRALVEALLDGTNNSRDTVSTKPVFGCALFGSESCALCVEGKP